jgi:hypothetical protein
MKLRRSIPLPRALLAISQKPRKNHNSRSADLSDLCRQAASDAMVLAFILMLGAVVALSARDPLS